MTHHAVPKLTLAAVSPLYGGYSKAPRKAPSLSPPRSCCLICDERLCTSDADTEGTVDERVAVEKLAGDSGSRRSMLMVRQLMFVMLSENRAVVVRQVNTNIVWCSGVDQRGTDGLSKQPSDHVIVL